MSDPTVERLTAYADRLRYEDLPREAVHQVKRLIIDSMGCGLAAFHSEPVNAARELALGVTGSSTATLLGTRTKTTPDLAAFVNGTMVRYLDFNDSYNGKDIAHPSDNIPVIMAAGEAHGASARDLIAAVVLAYEVQAAWADSFQLAAGGHGIKRPTRRSPRRWAPER
jgi:2-methylcitrate dehydratase